MIGLYFDMILDFFSRIITIDFGIGVSLGSIIIAFFTLLAFLRFFIKPILGASLNTDGSSQRKPKKEK